MWRVRRKDKLTCLQMQPPVPYVYCAKPVVGVVQMWRVIPLQKSKVTRDRVARDNIWLRKRPAIVLALEGGEGMDRNMQDNVRDHAQRRNALGPASDDVHGLRLPCLVQDETYRPRDDAVVHLQLVATPVQLAGGVITFAASETAGSATWEVIEVRQRCHPDAHLAEKRRRKAEGGAGVVFSVEEGGGGRGQEARQRDRTLKAATSRRVGGR
ncbi:hypothetical protein C8F04DRAFT_1188032 [Mycena alexandri]|uniref:Uncharacterized protein n=1 Tax=Mycena alexandri TaxID=1745969 RepID=A0AAD6SJE6_9AGAR|nr:hypothetical protein C8F04DRAFT_1188032 [Mycena alexandri]